MKGRGERDEKTTEIYQLTYNLVLIEKISGGLGVKDLKHSKYKILKLEEQFIKNQNEIDQLKKERENLQSEVEKYRKAFEDTKKERDCQIAEYQKKIEELENHYKFSMMQIDDVLVTFLGVKHEIMDKPSDFEKVLQEMIDKSRTFVDLLPTEPIKIVDMLISASEECEPLTIDGTQYKDAHKIFSTKDLEQIAQHLLVYCEHNSEENV